MQITFDPFHLTDEKREFLLEILDGVKTVSAGIVQTNPASQFMSPFDHPSYGADTGVHLTNGANMGAAPQLTTQDANAAFGGAGGAPLAQTTQNQTMMQNQQQQGATQNSGAAGSPTGGATNLAGLDKAGLPWDARIHSSSKELNKDGTWRGKRNTPKETIVAVEAELRQVLAAGRNVQATPMSQMQQQPQTQAQQAIAQAMQASQQYQQQQAQPQGQQQQQYQPQQAQVIDFPTLSMEVANLQSTGKLAMPELFEIVGLFGISAFHLLQARPDLVPQVWQQIQLRTAGR